MAWLCKCSRWGILHDNIKDNVNASNVSTSIQQNHVFGCCRLIQCFYLQWILLIIAAGDPAPIYLQMNLTNPVQLHWTSTFFFFFVSSIWQVAYDLQCSTSLTSVWVCHAPFCDPNGWFKSSTLLEAVKFLNPIVARNQPHHIFLQFACAAVLRFYLSFLGGPHDGTFSCSQLCILNHFSSWCCCRELICSLLTRD